MASIYTYSFLSPTGTAGADVNLINSNLRITGAPVVNMKQGTQSQYLDTLIETREVVTVTPPAATAAGQVYTLRIQQVNRGRNISKTFSYTSIAADSATVICNAWRAMIALDPEFSLTVGGTGTLILTAGNTGVDLEVIAVTFSGTTTITTSTVNSAGTPNTLATTYTFTSTTSGLTTLTGATGSQPVVGNGLVAGMPIRVTLNAGETGSVTMADGTVYTAGQSFITRLAAVSNNATVTSATIAFGISNTGDSNIVANTIALVPAVALVGSVARGSSAELATRGLVGIPTSGGPFAEIRLNWLEVPANGGAAISKTHSVFVDTSVSANYNPFRWRTQSALAANTMSTTTLTGTAAPEASAIW